MAKGQTNLATDSSKNLINQAQTQTAPIIQGLQGQQTQAQQNQQSQGNAAQQGFQQQQTTGGYDPTQLAGLRQTMSGLSTTGGYDPTQLAGLQQSQQQATSTGGYDANTLKNLLSSGGYDTNTLNGLLSGYGNFASTGGFSDQDKTNFVNQATSGVGNTYDQLKQQAQQSLSKTGGLGGAGAISQMARQLGQAQSNATLGAETSLNQQVNANKLAGLGGLGQTGAGVAGNILSAAGSEAAGTLQGLNQEAGLQQAVAQGKQTGAGQQAALEGNVAAGSNAANQGLAGLYNTTTNQLGTLGSQILQGLGLNFGTQANAINALVGLSKNPGAFQTGVGDVIGLLGAGGH